MEFVSLYSTEYISNFDMAPRAQFNKIHIDADRLEVRSVQLEKRKPTKIEMVRTRQKMI